MVEQETNVFGMNSTLGFPRSELAGTSIFWAFRGTCYPTRGGLGFTIESPLPRQGSSHIILEGFPWLIGHFCHTYERVNSRPERHQDLSRQLQVKLSPWLVYRPYLAYSDLLYFTWIGSIGQSRKLDSSFLSPVQGISLENSMPLIL